MEQTMGQDGGAAAPARWMGLVLLAAPLLEIVGMAHHPSVQARDPAALAAGLRTAASRSAWVHGGLIALMFATLVALLEFSVARSLRRPAVRAALIVYGAGVLLMTCAALVSGFVTGRVAVTAGLDPDTAVVAQLASFAMLLNQAFAPCGAVLMSLGIALWSVDLWRDTAPLTRSLAAFGVLAGLATMVALFSGALRLDVHGMALVTLVQAVWTIGAGAWLLRRSSAVAA
jgi:hypothetical protein